ncbi:MAG: FG-GAP repeat domain-containing protein, partial [Planctomycetaceae bacterium]
ATTYSPTFATWAYDVNGDGWADLVCVGFPGKPFHWFENPQNKAGDWKQHEIWHSACNESPQFVDVTGDGRPELVLGSQPEGQVGYLEIPAGEKVYAKWNFVAVSQPKSPDSQDKTPPPGTAPFYHGLGVGDVNRDGRNDIVIPHGWWEQPAKGKASSGPWEFHPWNLTADGQPGYLPAAHMFLDDLDLDGDQDVIMSSAHQVGVWWFENAGPGHDPQFKYHLISDAVTQTHAAQYVDINGDGTKDLVTGKRWWAHGPKGDVRPDDDPIVVWFEIQKVRGEAPKFIPHVIGESSGTGVGTQFLVFDVNGDKRPDIVLSNKRGTNLLRQRATGK